MCWLVVADIALFDHIAIIWKKSQYCLFIKKFFLPRQRTRPLNVRQAREQYAEKLGNVLRS